MLNSDMSLLKAIFTGVPRDQGEAACTYDTCPDAATAPLVRSYAADNALWLANFRAVFVRMLTHGEQPCLLDVYPSMGSGLTAEQEHGVTEIRTSCADQGFAPPGTVLVGGGGPAAPSVPPAAGPGEAPEEVRCFNGSKTAGAPAAGPAPTPTAEAEAEVQAETGGDAAPLVPAEAADSGAGGLLCGLALRLLLLTLCVAPL